MSYNNTHTMAAPIDNVVGIQFCILSPEEIKKTSVAEIYTQETYDTNLRKFLDYFIIKSYDSLLKIKPKKTQEMIEDYGHMCLFTPKFHPELAFIELYWAQAKQYTRDRLDRSWKGLKRSIWEVFGIHFQPSVNL